MSERPDFERVLAEHEDYGLYSDAGGDTHYVCACDKAKRPGSHRAHLAAALNAEVARWLADEGTRRRMTEAIAARWAHPESMHPQFAADFDAALAALAATETTADEKGAGR